ncbi:MAG TPA: ABC transporter permease [Bryobacteraceae bacterium]|nr:ABC transporter permease [Bryobacteraceae bacterium]
MRLRDVWRRIAFLSWRDRHLEDVDEELRLHHELRARAFEEQGLTPESAAIAAQRRLGNRTYVKESAWDVWSIAPIENAWRDLKIAIRVLRGNPGFTILAVLTLALGIGATTAMFSVIDNVLVEPFPYAHQQRLATLVIHDLSSNQFGFRTLLPPAEFLDYKQKSGVFDDVMGVAISRATWTTAGTPESVNAPLVTGNTFQFLGVRPLLGRFAVPSDATPGSPPVCVMSYSFWQSRFAGDPGVIGKTLILDGTPRTVIGVMPRRFVFWSADVWIPAALRHDRAALQPPWFYLLGRLKIGLTVEKADPQIQILADRLAAIYRPNLYPRDFTASLQTFADSSVGKFRQTLFTLLAAVGLLLLIACANVANLLLARVTARKREFAIRNSLGAGWWRVVRQLFIESGVIAILGAATGCLFAWGGLKVLVAVLPHDTFPDEAVIGLNLHVLEGTVAVAILTALFFGLVPVISGLRRDLNDALKSDGREHTDVGGGQLRNVLTVCEVAISLVLLAAAAVTMRSFLREREVQLGLNPQHLLTAKIFLTKDNRSLEQQVRFIDGLTNTLRRMPGVLDVATTSDFPPFVGAPTEFAVAGKPHSEQYDGQFAMIDANLFRTLGVSLLRGRNLTDADILRKRMFVVVNQALVDKFFRDKDPIGQQIEVTTLAYLPQPLRNPSFEIVGVVRNFTNRGLRQPVVPEAFVPYTISALGGFSVILRTAGAPDALGKTVEGTALTLDGSAVVRHVRTMEQGLEDESYAKPRFGVEIYVVFAALGLLLASTGLYGVMSYTVSQRKREMGIRVALGAKPGDVQRLVIETGMRFVAIGILAGLLGSFLLLRFIQSQTWGVSTYDPITLGSVAGILIVIGLAACYVPSMAATRVDPARTLRSE